MGNFLSSCIGKPNEVNVNVNQSSVTQRGNSLVEKGKDLLKNISSRKSLESDQFEKRVNGNDGLNIKGDYVDYTSYENGAFYNTDDIYFGRVTPTMSNLTEKDSTFSNSLDSNLPADMDRISPLFQESNNQTPIVRERIGSLKEQEEDLESDLELDYEYNNKNSKPVSPITEDLTLSFTDSSESKTFVGSPTEGNLLKERRRLNELYKFYHQKD